MSDVQPTGQQLHTLHDALLDAFPTLSDLQKLVRFGLNENIQSIAGTGNLSQVVFELLQWMRARGRLAELIEKALEDNPGNPQLNAWVQENLSAVPSEQNAIPEAHSQEQLPSQQPTSEPETWQIPPEFQETGLYVSRSEKEKEIIDAFQEKNSGGQTYRIVTLWGYGGMGKTRLAIRCALNLAPFFKGKIFRVNLGDIPIEILSDEDAVARQVAAAIGTLFTLEGEALLPQNLPQHLPDEPVLIYLDNYETAKCDATDELMANIVGAKFGVHLLVSGREAIENDDIERKFDIEGLTPDEAESLLRQKIAANIRKRKLPLTPDEERVIPALVNRVEHIPLAIVLLAAQTNTLSLVEIEKGLRETTLGAMTALQDGQTRGKNTPHHRALLLSLTYSFERLSPQTQALFPVIGLFADAFSREAITAILDSPHTAKFLQELTAACLLDHTVDANAESYYGWLTPTHDFARLKFAEMEKQNAVQVAVLRERFGAYYYQFVHDCEQGIEKHDIAILQRLRSTWRNVVVACEVASTTLEFTLQASLLNNMGFFLDSQGHYSEAEPLYKEALEIRRSILPNYHLDIAISLNNLAELYRAQGRYSEMEGIQIEALTIRKAILPEGHPDIAQSLNNLAGLYANTGRHDEAVQLIKEALEMSRTSSSHTQDDIAISLNNLATLYYEMENYGEVEPLLKEVLAIWRHSLPKYHPRIAASLNNLAVFYDREGRYDEAEPLYREALEIKQKSLPEGHPDIALSFTNLANMYNVMARYDEAEPLFLAAAQIAAETLKVNHPTTKRYINNFAMFLEEKAEREKGSAE